MALGTPSQTQVQNPVPQQQLAQQQIQPQRQPQSPQQQQLMSPMAQQQPQLTYPGHGGNQALPAANFYNQQAPQSQQSQVQTPLPVANFSQMVQTPQPQQQRMMQPINQQVPQ
jgi:hypothetical protein